MTYFQEIKHNLENGKNYESTNWYTINRHKEGLRMIIINDENYFYSNLDSYARKVKKLLNWGC